MIRNFSSTVKLFYILRLLNSVWRVSTVVSKWAWVSTVAWEITRAVVFPHALKDFKIITTTSLLWPVNSYAGEWSLWRSLFSLFKIISFLLILLKSKCLKKSLAVKKLCGESLLFHTLKYNRVSRITTQTSVQHKDHSFSAPKIRHLNNKNPSIQHIPFSSTRKTFRCRTEGCIGLKCFWCWT